MSLSPKSIFLVASFAAVVAGPCFLVVGDANAQAPAAPLAQYPTCTNKPTAQDTEAARSAFLLGPRFFEESDYSSAAHNFMDAYKLDCTKLELLLNIARSNELLGNRAEAVHALETYLSLNQGLSPEDKAQLQRRIDNLKAAISQAAVVPPPAPTATPAATTTAPPPPPPPPPVEERHHTVAPWILVGVGGAAAVAGGILFFVGNGDISTAEQTCPGGKCPAAATGASSAKSTGETGDTLKVAGSVVFWSGIAVAGGGILWHFLEPTGPAQESAPKTSFTPVLAPGYGGVAAVGTF